MIFTQLVITFNVMMFISTVLMHFFGVYIYNIKSFSIYKIVFNALVPIIASSHHRSIIEFQWIVEKLNKNNI
jgi:hypothetical protein